jgi:hypothetical protein
MFMPRTSDGCHPFGVIGIFGLDDLFNRPFNLGGAAG